MSRAVRNFTPIENRTIVFSSSALSANTQFTVVVPNSNPAVLPSQIEVMNALTVGCFIAFGTDNTTSATVASGYYVGPGVDKILDIGLVAWIAVIPVSSTSGSVYISRGLGS